MRAILLVLVLSVAALILEFAAFATLRADNPWMKALPSLVPFAALVATVFFAVEKDAWIPKVARAALRALLAHPLRLYAATCVALVCAVVAGWHVQSLATARDGRFTIQVVETNDVPGERLSGIPVTVDHKLRRETVEQVTDADGRAEFAVHVSDVFAVRMRQSGEPAAPVVVLASDARVDEKSKRHFTLVRRAMIDTAAWIDAVRALTEAERRGAFAQVPAAFFQWKRGADGTQIITVDSTDTALPFSLPEAEIIIRRRQFTVGFSPRLRLPRWVAYRIMPGPPQRRGQDRFAADPAIPASYQASVDDYARNPYDRGHLVRRTDLFGWGEGEWRKAYFLSAVVPQLGYVNTKSWQAVENYASDLAMDRTAVYVIRGPVFAATGASGMVNTTLIGDEMLPVPTHFFQITLRATPQGVLRADAHVVPNAYVAVDTVGIEQFRVTTARVSELTGLTFDSRLRP